MNRGIFKKICYSLEMQKNIDPQRQKLLDEIVTKIIGTAHPSKIILFGSASRGQMGPHSDFDLLIIIDNSTHCRRTTQNIYKNLLGIEFSADIIVIHEEDAELLKNQEGTIVKTAFSEGRILHAA